MLIGPKALLGIGKPLSAVNVGISTSSALAKLPVGSIVMYDGDSIVAGGTTYPGAGYSNQNMVGASTWGQVFSGNRVLLPIGANKAVGGTTTTQIAARLAADIAAVSPAPKAVYINGGHNDVQATPAASISNWAGMIATIRAAGARALILPVLPFTGMDATAVAFMNAVNAYLASQVSGDVALIDATGFDAATMTYDGVHPNNVGGRFLGPRWAAALDKLVAPGRILLAADDPANLATNGGFAGAGPLATSWTLQNLGGGATVATSLSENPDGGNWQQLELSGTFTAAANVYVDIAAAMPVTLPAGSQVQVAFAVEVDAGATNIEGVSGYFIFYGPGFVVRGVAQVLANSIAWMGGDQYLSGVAFSGVIASDIMTLSGDVDTVYFAMRANLAQAGGVLPAALTCRMGNATIVDLGA
jgi:lysophospholipase L1-like esterase